MPAITEKGSAAKICSFTNFASKIMIAAHTALHPAISTSVTNVPIIKKRIIFRIYFPSFGVSGAFFLPFHSCIKKATNKPTPHTTMAESAILNVGQRSKPKRPKNLTSIKSTTPSALKKRSSKLLIPPPIMPLKNQRCNRGNSDLK